MIKKILFVLLILYILITMTSEGIKLQEKLNISIPNVDTIIQKITSYQNQKQNEIQNKVNLCSFMVDSDLEVEAIILFQKRCIEKGGEFRCNAMGIGCYNTDVEFVNSYCNSTAYQMLSKKCESVGGKSVCNSNNLIFCEYLDLEEEVD